MKIYPDLHLIIQQRQTPFPQAVKAMAPHLTCDFFIVIPGLLKTVNNPDPDWLPDSPQPYPLARHFVMLVILATVWLVKPSYYN